MGNNNLVVAHLTVRIRIRLSNPNISFPESSISSVFPFQHTLFWPASPMFHLITGLYLKMT